MIGLAVIGLVVGLLTWAALHTRYRNDDKAHEHDRESVVRAEPVRERDTLVRRTFQDDAEFLELENNRQDFAKRLPRLP